MCLVLLFSVTSSEFIVSVTSHPSLTELNVANNNLGSFTDMLLRTLPYMLVMDIVFLLEVNPNIWHLITARPDLDTVESDFCCK